MEIVKSKIFLCGFFILFLFACPVRGQGVEDDKEFSYDEESPLGPNDWGNIRPEWRFCSCGKMQSPIDIRNNKVTLAPYLGRLLTNYKPSYATLVKTGHDVMLSWVMNTAGSINIYGTLYRLTELHWHSPTEHSINGKRFNLEAHLVHESPDGRLAVIGILYTIGHADSFLYPLEKYLKALADTRDTEEFVGIVDPNRLKIGWGYYRYNGSLTTPPCYEGVIWTIIKKVRTISKYQLKLIQRAIDDDFVSNARPIQPLNGRTIKLYKSPYFPVFP